MPSFKPIRLFFLGIVFVSDTFVNAQTPFALKDLEVLAQTRQTREFFEHIEDIAPHKRGDAYKELVLEMAAVHGKRLKSQGIPSLEELEFYDGLYRYPIIREDGIYQNYRDKLALRYLEHCLPSSSTLRCISWLEHTWVRSRKTADLAWNLWLLWKTYGPFKGEKTLRISPDSLLGPITAGKFSEFYCTKPLLRAELWGLFQRTPLKKMLRSSGPMMGLSQTCARLVLESWKKKIAPTNKNFDQEYAQKLLSVLAHEKLLSFQEKAQFHIHYLLSDPEPGALFNYAWSTLEQLASRPSQREQLIRSWKILQHFPGKVFLAESAPEKKRAEVILKALNKNFPEYLNAYAKHCSLEQSKTCELFAGIAQNALIPVQIEPRSNAASASKDTASSERD